MDTSNFWWQAAGVDPGPGPGPGPDPGDPINQSLRFRGNATLTGPTVSSSVFTVSYWAKIGGPMSVTSGGDYYHWAAGAGSSDTGTMVYVNYNTNTSTTGQFRLEAANNDPASAGRFRDVAAWYHVVVNRDGTNTTMWVNGEQQIAPVAASALSNQFLIGNGHDGGAGTHFKGYMADWYFIDGQALEPTAFGRFNANGVWVPVDYSGSFGSNGFHLDFADPSNLGKDVANGNDFTATGFDTLAPNNWESKATFGPAYVSNVRPTSIIFDGQYDLTSQYKGHWFGNGATASSGGYADDDLTGIFQAIDNITDIALNIYPRNGTVTLRINGSDIGSVSSRPSGPVEMSVTWDGSVITSAILVQSGDSYYSIGGIKINNQLLVNSSGTDYDLMQDSPTQNYATLNPIYKNTAIPRFATLSAANLVSGPGLSPGDYSASTIAIKGNTYIETITTYQNPADPNNPGINIFDINTPDTPGRYRIYRDGTADKISAIPGWNPTPTWGQNDVVQIQLNVESSPMQVGIAVNGGTYVFNDLEFDPSNNIGIGVMNDKDGYVAINYGQQPFVYTPPDGFKALQTQNMPAATIANGRDHFQAITGPGQGADGGVPGQLPGNWSSYFVSSSGWKALASVAGDATYAFDANLSTRATTNLGNSTITFEPPGGIEFTDGLEILGRPDQLVSLNDGADVTTLDGDSGAWTEMATGAGTLNKLFWSSAPAGAACTCNAIRINPGTATEAILVDANILAIAQQTFPNGLWWIKSRVVDANTTQHMFVDSVRGQVNGNWQKLNCPNINKGDQNYTPPAGNSVAWCWSAPDTFTPTVTGGLTNVTARRNVTAGFSMIAYTGSAQTGTITHGLDEAPEFMITKIRTGALGGGTAQPIWQVRHRDLTGGMTSVTGAGGILSLNLDVAQFANTHGTVTVTADGTGIQTNIKGGGSGTADADWWQSGANGQNYIAYCWHSVPGYSAIGSYTGNGTVNDGPFVYTGFKVGWLLARSTAGGSWAVWDTTRTPNNPNQTVLRPNMTNGDNDNQVYQFDLLSNGFKVRINPAGDMNVNNSTIIYCAFSENPFGSSNTSPATAR